jgi:hypothetical protein
VRAACRRWMRHPARLCGSELEREIRIYKAGEFW